MVVVVVLAAIKEEDMGIADTMAGKVVVAAVLLVIVVVAVVLGQESPQHHQTYPSTKMNTASEGTTTRACYIRMYQGVATCTPPVFVMSWMNGPRVRHE